MLAPCFGYPLTHVHGSFLSQQRCSLRSSATRSLSVRSCFPFSYFDILEDTLIGYRIPAFRKVMKRRLVQAPRFYYFDVGVANHLLHRKDMVRGTDEYGHAFEHLVVQELYAYLHYCHSEEQLSYWRTYTGIEVDAVIGDARVAIEIKSVEEVRNSHLKGLKAFGEEYPQSRRITVSLDRINRKIGEIECFYIKDFLAQLWCRGI